MAPAPHTQVIKQEMALNEGNVPSSSEMENNNNTGKKPRSRGRNRGRKNTQTRNTSNENVVKPEEVASNQKVNSQSTSSRKDGKKKDSRKKKKNPGSEMSQIRNIASLFYDHLKEDSTRLQRAADREQTGVIFRDFYQNVYLTQHEQQPNEGNANARPKAPARRDMARLESLVMASLREQRLVKSRRATGRNNQSVIMTFATNEPGVFPTSKEQKSTVRNISRAREQLEQNKKGVSISESHPTANAPSSSEMKTGGSSANIHTALKPEYDSFQLVALYEPEDPKEKPTPLVQLDSVQLSGPHKHLFSLEHFPLPAPLLASEAGEEESLMPYNVKVCFRNTSKRIGVFRASVTFQFSVSSVVKKETEHFQIARYFALRVTGDSELQALLQPTTPYERPPKRYRDAKNMAYERDTVDGGMTEDEENAILAPPLPEMSKGVNPFRTLPHERIPADVLQLLANFELSTLLEELRPSTSDGSVEGYSTFWKNLLWASEFQNYMDLQMYDMENVHLQLERGRNGFYSLQVPGLAEGRPSVLRGDLVHVKLEKNKKLFKGRVQSTRLLDVILDFLPAFHKSCNPALDTVNVSFTLSRMTYRTSHAAVTKAETQSMKETMLCPIPKTLEDILSAASSTERSLPSSSLKWANINLNPEQQEAVRNIVRGKARPLPYIIFGPPGTGKTTTVIEAVYQLAKHRDKLNILVVAPSNDAADVLLERLAPYFPPSEMIRILAYTRSMDSVPATVQPYSKEGLDSETQAREIQSHRIVVATVNMAARFSYLGVSSGYFDALVVDESGHATEPEVIAVAASSLLDFQRIGDKKRGVGQLVLAGDPKQLGPIVSSDVAQKFGLSSSYLERLMGREVYCRGPNGLFPPNLLTKLVQNYRSHPAIIKLPNEMFYDNELLCCGDKLSTHNMANWEHSPSKGFPVLFHAMEGENLREARSPSWFNPQEAEQVVRYTEMLLNDTKPPLRAEEIGIITPYARQVQKIRIALGASKKISNSSEIKVGSVESFQGQERRCIIVSTVRSETEYLSHDLRFSLGFVASEKRFNVAITRAKSLLIVVGSAKVLSQDKENWLPFLKYCRDNKGWAGDDWDPAEAVEDEDEDAGDKFEDDDSWDVVPGPSEAARQEACAFINREE